MWKWCSKRSYGRFKGKQPLGKLSMNKTSLIKKALNVLHKYQIRKFAVNGNMFYIGQDINADSVHKIVLYFPDREFMHFGDHLFFEPLSRFLKTKGFNIIVMPIKEMEFYFRCNGYAIASSEDIETADLIITRTEFLKDVKILRKNVLYIDTACSKVKNYLCQDIANKVADFLSIPSNNFYAKPSILKSYNSSIELDGKYDYLIFNNYIESGFYRITKWHMRKIRDFTKSFAADKKLKVIHVGTADEKKKDKNYYNFVNIDLRGETTPADMFYLASLDNVKYNVSFDGFIMHIFSIYGKKSYVLFRGRFTKTAKNYIINYVNPPFDPIVKKDKLIEYI